MLWCSHYQKDFKAKILIGCVKSDSQITVYSELIDLLEVGDVVLAGKEFRKTQKS